MIYALPMNDAHERIQWVIRFAEQDLDRLRPGDWVNLRDDMWLFLRGLPLGQYDELRSVPFTEAELAQYTLESFAAVQVSAKDMLRRIARTNANLEGTPVERVWLQGEEIAGKIERVYFDFSRPGPLRLYVSAEHLRDAFLFALGAALCTIEITDLRECQSPSCERIFLAGHGRQVFCSPQCKTREASRRYREGHKEKVNAEAQARYEQKVKARLGAGTRIQRRAKRQATKEIAAQEREHRRQQRALRDRSIEAEMGRRKQRNENEKKR